MLKELCRIALWSSYEVLGDSMSNLDYVSVWECDDGITNITLYGITGDIVGIMAVYQGYMYYPIDRSLKLLSVVC